MSELNHSTPNANGQADHNDSELPIHERPGVSSVLASYIQPGTPTAEPHVMYESTHSEEEGENGDAVPRSQADGPDTASTAVNGRDPNRRRRAARHTANNGEHPTPLSSHLPQDDSATRGQWESAWSVQLDRRGEQSRTSSAGDSTQTVHPHTPSNSPASLDNQSVDSLTSPGRNRRAPGPAPSLTHMSSSDSKAFFNQFRDEERDGGSA